jgi:hypothetical protein
MCQRLPEPSEKHRRAWNQVLDAFPESTERRSFHAADGLVPHVVNTRPALEIAGRRRLDVHTRNLADRTVRHEPVADLCESHPGARLQARRPHQFAWDLQIPFAVHNGLHRSYHGTSDCRVTPFRQSTGALHPWSVHARTA